MTEKHWMEEPYGVPHKNGMVRFYLVGIDEDVHDYLGWFDMTDWDKGWKTVWEAAIASRKRMNDLEPENIQVLRHDQMLDLMRNVQWAFELALEDKNETNFHYWWNKEKQEKQDD